MPTRPSMSIRLQQAREWAGFSQQQAADMLGIARESISYWENGRRIVPLLQLERLAAIYGTTVGYLSGRTPAPIFIEEHALLYRAIDAQGSLAKSAVQWWLAFLDEWSRLMESFNERLPGRGRPPREVANAVASATDSRQAPASAALVREHYDLGIDAISDLFVYLNEKRILVFRVPLGPLTARSGLSGMFYNHPKLGFCILVNADTTPGRQVFTLAHEFAHALFHYQETGLVSRAGDDDRKERFADVFAGHFLVPSAALHSIANTDPEGYIFDPFDVVRLQRYFCVSYATILYRLRSEGLLPHDRYHEYQQYSPGQLAARLGIDLGEYRGPLSILGTYPASILERIRQLLREGKLSTGQAAELLRVNEETINGQLLATLPQAQGEERREFDELPQPRHKLRRTDPTSQR